MAHLLICRQEIVWIRLDLNRYSISLQIARRLHLSSINGGAYEKIPGGMAIEFMARTSTNQTTYPMPTPRSASRDCDFSFSGIRTAAERLICRLEKEQTNGVLPVDVVASICNSCQIAVARHFCRRLQRAVEYCVLNSLLPPSVHVPPKTWPTCRPKNMDLSAPSLVSISSVHY